MLEIKPNENEATTKILVIGVGGAGSSNAVNPDVVVKIF